MDREKIAIRRIGSQPLVGTSVRVFLYMSLTTVPFSRSFRMIMGMENIVKVKETMKKIMSIMFR